MTKKVGPGESASKASIFFKEFHKQFALGSLPNLDDLPEEVNCTFYSNSSSVNSKKKLKKAGLNLMIEGQSKDEAPFFGEKMLFVMSTEQNAAVTQVSNGYLAVREITKGKEKTFIFEYAPQASDFEGGELQSNLDPSLAVEGYGICY